MINQRIENIIIKNQIGEISEAEQVALNSWLAEDELNVLVMNQYEEIWEVSGDYESDYIPNSDAALNRHLELLAQENTPATFTKPTIASTATVKSINTNQSKSETKIFSLKRLSMAVAAVFVLGFASMFLFSSKKVVSTGSSPQFVSLNDGSLIWLDENSSIEYNSKFGKDNRNIKLKGKAFFDVNRNEELPFVINAGDLDVSVLGTSFTVDSDSSTPSVSVKSGKVKVIANSLEKVLSINDKVILSNNALESSKVEKVDFTWRNPELSFDNAPLSQVIADINLFYDSNIALSDSSIDCPLTAGGLATASFDEVVEILKLTYDLDESMIDQGKSIDIKSCK